MTTSAVTARRKGDPHTKYLLFFYKTLTRVVLTPKPCYCPGSPTPHVVLPAGWSDSWLVLPLAGPTRGLVLPLAVPTRWLVLPMVGPARWLVLPAG